MKSRLLTVFCGAITPQDLERSVMSFINQNISELKQFKLVVHLCRPSAETAEYAKTNIAQYTPYIEVSKSLMCAPCELKRHKVRYGVFVHASFRSVSPLWYYVDELKHTLQTVPEISHIKLSPDYETKNHITNAPLVYHYHTRHVLVGNGYLSAQYPMLVRSSTTSPTDPSGVLNTIVFQREDT
jgi:hypothetical protein